MSIAKEAPKTHRRLVDKCPECGSKNLVHDYDTGETVCGDCGLVLYEQMLDKGPEWRARCRFRRLTTFSSIILTRFSSPRASLLLIRLVCVNFC